MNERPHGREEAYKMTRYGRSGWCRPSLTVAGGGGVDARSAGLGSGNPTSANTDSGKTCTGLGHRPYRGGRIRNRSVKTTTLLPESVTKPGCSLMITIHLSQLQLSTRTPDRGPRQPGCNAPTMCNASDVEHFDTISRIFLCQ